jgi:hypothetical protein
VADGAGRLSTGLDGQRLFLRLACNWLRGGDQPASSDDRAKLEGREAHPTSEVIDSQSVKTNESGGVSGCAGGKKIKGRKCQVVNDMLAFLIFVLIHGRCAGSKWLAWSIRGDPPAAFHGCATSSPMTAMQVTS